MTATRVSRSQRTEAVALAFAAVARPIIRDYWHTRSCIASTRCALDALKAFGVRGEPLPVAAAAFNALAARRVLVEGQGEITDADVAEGAYSVGVGVTDLADDPNEWNGHLVAVVGRRLLVDASAEQFARPARDLVVPPVVVGALPGDWRTMSAPSGVRTGDRAAFIELAGGSVLAYWLQRWNVAFQSAKDWQLRERHAEPVRRIVAAMRPELDRLSLSGGSA